MKTSTGCSFQKRGGFLWLKGPHLVRIFSIISRSLFTTAFDRSNTSKDVAMLRLYVFSTRCLLDYLKIFNREIDFFISQLAAVIDINLGWVA
jgi:hypothetical protein